MTDTLRLAGNDDVWHVTYRRCV